MYYRQIASCCCEMSQLLKGIRGADDSKAICLIDMYAEDQYRCRTVVIEEPRLFSRGSLCVPVNRTSAATEITN